MPAPAPADDRDAVRAACTRFLGRPPVSAAAQLRAAADALAADAAPDLYGDGEIVPAFEARLAETLGHAAAVVMPTGTMAQQIALAIHCRARGADTVAFHPTCHLELHEHQGHAHLHGLRSELVGDRHRLIERADLDALTMSLGALLLELPQREIGGRLPEWDDLVAQTGWARERGIALHLDGARIWEAQPYYDRPHAEIGGLFDTVYVSLYKGLGGLGGCVLAGPQDVVAEARIWRRRHGGAMYRLYPLVASALSGLDGLVPRMGAFADHARALGAALSRVDGVTVVPGVPQTPLFHVHLALEPDVARDRALALARETDVWLLDGAMPADLPSTCAVELNVGEAQLDIAPDDAAALFARLLDPDSSPASDDSPA